MPWLLLDRCPLTICSGMSDGGNNGKRRGFAAMDREERIEMARRGGKAVHRKGVAHEWTTDTAKAAGSKGGIAARNNRRDRKAAAE